MRRKVQCLPVCSFLHRDWSGDLVAQRVVTSLKRAMQYRLEAEESTTDGERQQALADALMELREAAAIYQVCFEPGG